MGDYAITLHNGPQDDASRPVPTFDELFDAHHEKVLLAAYRVTGNLPDAEDVLQSVFLRLLNRHEKVAAAHSSAAYLCRMAINASLDLLRSRRRAKTEILDEETLPSTLGAADGETRQVEQRRHLQAALLTLDPRAAEVFGLRVFEDFSNAEVAAVLNTSSNSIAVTYHKARSQLRQVLGELEGEKR